MSRVCGNHVTLSARLSRVKTTHARGQSPGVSETGT